MRRSIVHLLPSKTSIGRVVPVAQASSACKKGKCFSCCSSSGFSTSITSSSQKTQSNLPLGVAAVSMSLLASVPGLLPLFVSKLVVASVFASIGIPAIIHAYSAVKIQPWVLLDVHSLMTFSAFASLAIGKGPEGAFLISLFHLAHAIQHRIEKKAKVDLNSLSRLVPDSALVLLLKDGTESIRSVSTELVPVGSTILVRPNSVCPIDGRLTSHPPGGSVAVQLSHLTGESAEVFKILNEIIPAGAVNLGNQAITLTTTSTGPESTLQRIVELSESAAYSRPKIASSLDQLAPKYSALVLLSTSCIALGGPLLCGWTLAASIYTALSFLVAASPCALLAASPVAQAAAVSACSRKGIILSSGAHALERFARTENIALDKTGTITQGVMQVSKVENVGGNNPDLCIELAAVVGRSSSHPVSRGIARYVKTDATNRFSLIPASLVEIPGQSVSATVRETPGKREWIVRISKTHDKSYHGKSVSRITAHCGDSSLECLVHLTDIVRPRVAESLRFSRFPIYMLTGDNPETALRVASDIGLSPEFVRADMKPSEKADFVIKEVKNCLMVGDGVNDAPALAAARAGGVAIASSADSSSIQSAAVSVADAVVICSPNNQASPIESVLFLIEKARSTSNIINANLIIAGIGMTGTALGVLFSGCPLWLAVLLHEGSTVAVVLNSLRNL